MDEQHIASADGNVFSFAYRIEPLQCSPLIVDKYNRIVKFFCGDLVAGQLFNPLDITVNFRFPFSKICGAFQLRNVHNVHRGIFGKDFPCFFLAVAGCLPYK